MNVKITHSPSGSKLEYEKITKGRPMHDKPIHEVERDHQEKQREATERIHEVERRADALKEEKRMDLPKALVDDVRERFDNAKVPEPLLQFFAYQHLPHELRQVSVHFFDLAHNMVNVLPRNPERTTMLRKLLEAKDCAVRAKLYQ